MSRDRVTIINTRTDKFVDDRGKDRDGERLSDSPKTSQMEIYRRNESGWAMGI